MNAPEWGDISKWGLALVVIFVALGFKFFTKGIASSAAILLGLIAGYLVGIFTGAVNFGGIAKAEWFAIPTPFKYGIEFSAVAIIGMCLISIVSAIETVGDISAIAKGGAGREATDKELKGGTLADGLGSAVAGVFGGLPNTSFSQNVGLISMTGVMSRGVVTVSGIFLIICGFIPKIGAIISAMPISVLGGGVILMFGMVVSASINMLSDVNWEPQKYAYSGDFTFIWPWSPGCSKINAASARFNRDAYDLRSVACGCAGGCHEPASARRCRLDKTYRLEKILNRRRYPDVAAPI